MRENAFILLFMLIAVPVAGELKFYPFQDDFRISFGTTAFFFFLLWLRPSMLAGVLTGVIVIIFRTVLDFLYLPAFEWGNSFRTHLPAFFFYAAFACLFTVFRINQLHQKPLLVGLLGTLAEIVANLAELSFRAPAWTAIFQVSVIGPIAVIAVIRCFFVLSFFNMIQLRQSKWMEEQQRIRNEHMLMLVSSLYEESIHLKKTLHQVEEITRGCYELYREMKDEAAGKRQDDYAKRVLLIAGQVHEVKKDNQRIYAGLSKLISEEQDRDFMPLKELLGIVAHAHEKYARMLGKTIRFEMKVDAPYLSSHIYTTLSLVNNLVANAVESISQKGTVSIEVSVGKQEGWIHLSVGDDGPGIFVKDKEMLFMPGFTTKYDVSGRPSTGIGLCYVKEVTDNLQGYIDISQQAGKFSTVFTIRLPIASLVQRG